MESCRGLRGVIGANDDVDPILDNIADVSSSIMVASVTRNLHEPIQKLVRFVYSKYINSTRIVSEQEDEYLLSANARGRFFGSGLNSLSIKSCKASDKSNESSIAFGDEYFRVTFNPKAI